MLRQAAIDAVAAARYRPFLLNGEPVEVQTSIHIIFSLGGLVNRAANCPF